MLMLGLTCNLLWLIILIEKSLIFDQMESRIKDFLLCEQVFQSRQVLWIAFKMNETQGQIFGKSSFRYSSSNTVALPSRILKCGIISQVFPHYSFLLPLA